MNLREIISLQLIRIPPEVRNIKYVSSIYILCVLNILIHNTILTSYVLNLHGIYKTCVSLQITSLKMAIMDQNV
jgi:hypothetical protein